jgi:hypothetical protein
MTLFTVGILMVQLFWTFKFSINVDILATILATFQNIGRFSGHPACRQQGELKVLSTPVPGRCAGWTGHWGPELKFGWKCSNPSLPPDGDPPPSSPPSPCPSSPTRPRPDRVSLRCRREVLTRPDFKLFFLRRRRKCQIS